MPKNSVRRQSNVTARIGRKGCDYLHLKVPIKGLPLSRPLQYSVMRDSRNLPIGHSIGEPQFTYLCAVIHGFSRDNFAVALVNFSPAGGLLLFR